MKKAAGEYDTRSEKIGFDEWNLEAMEEYQAFIKRIVKEGMAIATTRYECSAYFPIEWQFADGSDGIQKNITLKDPTTIYVELPIGPDEDDQPRWSFQLTDLVESMIEGSEAGEGGPIGPEMMPGLIAVRDRLRELADVLDRALERK